jgi:hypothetical protein
VQVERVGDLGVALERVGHGVLREARLVERRVCGARVQGVGWWRVVGVEGGGRRGRHSVTQSGACAVSPERVQGEGLAAAGRVLHPRRTHSERHTQRAAHTASERHTQPDAAAHLWRCSG